MSSAADQAIAEINDRLAIFAPQHEGLRDFARLNLEDTARQEVAATLALFDRRYALLQTAEQALQALVADGHPTIPTREISGAAFADLQGNTSTIEAAMKLFTSNAATTIALEPGPVSQK